MLPGLAHAAAMWTAWYSDSPVIRTTVNFAHIAGLVVGGGAAIVEDRAMLAALRQDEDARRRRVEAQRLAHRVVLSGLAIAVASGCLLFAADWDTYLYSKVFWVKMVLVLMLLINGLMMTRTETSIDRDASAGESDASSHWRTLHRTAVTSFTLWFATAALGVALANFA